MSKEVLTFDTNDFQKRKFHYFRHQIDIKNVDIDKIIIPNRVPSGKKRF